MEKATKFYIHIQSDTLAHYLVRGIFCPSRFLHNKNRDIQDQYESFLLLSDKQWNADSDCSIEIKLIEEDIAQLIQIQNHYFVLKNCLPISRLLKIHFSEKDKAENVIWNINQGAAFVPEWAISFQYKAKQDTVELSENNNFSETYAEHNVKTKMDRYDRLMGGFAFMKVGTGNLTYQDLDTTVNYLSAATYFNKHIANEIEHKKILLNTKIQTIFSGKNEIFKYLAKPITYDEVVESGKREKQLVVKNFNTIQFDAIDPDSLTYKLAILHSYGKGKAKSDNDLVSGLLSTTSSKLVEELALVYGLYTGYSAVRNSYSMRNHNIPIKFKLDTKLEFYVVESLFNYAFKDHQISGKIDFLDKILQKDEVSKTKDNFNYIELLSDQYTYQKQEKSTVEKDSLTSILLNTIKKWCQKNDAKLDEKQLLKKLSESIIPDIRKVITSNRNVAKVEKTVLPNKTEVTKKTAAELPTYTKASKSNYSNQQKNAIKEPSLFSELPSNENLIQDEGEEYLTIAKLENKSVTTLKALCKEKGFKGYSRLNKKDLIKFILSQ